MRQRIHPLTLFFTLSASFNMRQLAFFGEQRLLLAAIADLEYNVRTKWQS
jgi:hypothetical protein